MNRSSRRRSPLGEAIADVRRVREERKNRAKKPWKRVTRASVRTIVNEALGKQAADHVIETARYAVIEDAVRSRKDPAKCKARVNKRADRPLVSWRSSPRSEESEIVRRFVALVLMIAEHIILDGEKAGWAQHSKERRDLGTLWIGQQRRKTSGREWLYVPKDQQGGLAARLDCDVRTIERMIAVLVEGGVLRNAWQPPADEMAPDRRGDTYAYQIYQLAEVPASLVARLRRWRAMELQAAGVERRTATTDEGDADGAGLCVVVAELTGDLEASRKALDFVRGLKGAGPPPGRV